MGKRKNAPPNEAMIENCEVQFRFRCPKQWEQLTATDDAKVRFCGVCEKNVFLCESRAELLECTREGRCIATYIGPMPALGEMVELY
jgi:hypothetical protein